MLSKAHHIHLFREACTGLFVQLIDVLLEDFLSLLAIQCWIASSLLHATVKSDADPQRQAQQRCCRYDTRIDNKLRLIDSVGAGQIKHVFSSTGLWQAHHEKGNVKTNNIHLAASTVFLEMTAGMESSKQQWK